MKYATIEKLQPIVAKLGLRTASRYAKAAYYWFRHKRYEYRAARIRAGKDTRISLKMKEFKNIHAGERCFIIATGPSLTVADVEKLKDEITISMNSICKLFPKTDWRPTYYGIQDPYVFDALRDDPCFQTIRNKFVGDVVPENDCPLGEGDIVYYLDLFNHISKIKPKGNLYGFSDDASAVVRDGFSITYSLIQIAVYMGFTEIYLLGCDTKFTGPKQHFEEYGVLNTDDPTMKLLPAYRMAREWADAHGVKIKNATRGGNLEVFERVDFDSLFPGTDAVPQ